MNIQPISDRILVKKEDQKEQMKSGIVLPTGSEDKNSSIGSVIAVGPGRKGDKGETIPLSVEVGQKVIYTWGERVDLEGEEYYLVSESSILGVIK